MSILNAWVSPARALVCVDTAGGDQAGRRSNFSKLTVLPHCMAVLGFRGSLPVFTQTVALTLYTPGLTFDELVKRFPSIVDDTVRMLRALPECPESIHGSYILAGFSSADDRIVGYYFDSRASGGCAVSRIPLLACAPWEESLNAPPEDLGSIDAMKAFAELQREVLAQLHPECPTNGNLVFAEITANAVRVSSRT